MPGSFPNRWSVRPRPQATVSAPLRWEEIRQVKPEDFDILSIPQRLKQTGDLFARALSAKQSLDNVLQQLRMNNLSESQS